MLLKILSIILSLGLSFCIITPFKKCKSNDFAFWSYWLLLLEANTPPKNLTQENISYKSDKKIQYPNKLYLHKNTIAFSETLYDSNTSNYKYYGANGIHFLDISDLGNITNKGFINVPGSNEIAIKESTLFTDSYDDLASIDVSDIENPKLNDLYLGVFPYDYSSYFPVLSSDSSESKLERKSCENITFTFFDILERYSTDDNDSSASAVALLSSSSKGSSISRFTIVGDRLYAVTYTELIVFDISDVYNIQEVNREKITHDLNIETIYPITNYLLLGAVNGMYIYNISDKDFPVYMSHIDHIVSCDPVVAEGNTAYITLSSFGTNCRTGEDRLEIIDISDIENPSTIVQYDLDTPGSLAIDGNVLFVVTDRDNENKLEVLDVSDTNNIRSYKTITDAKFIDIIMDNGKAYALAQNGLYVYDYSDPTNIVLSGKYVDD